jgi:hypothetical protein
MELVNAPLDRRIDEMSVRKMKFVLVNDMAPYRRSAVCAACSRPLERRYLHDFFSSKRYCGIECDPPMDGGEWNARINRSGDPFELAMTWPQLTFEVAPVLFDHAWSDHRD